MCLSVLQSTRKSCIILCMSLVCTAGLNFCDESYAFSCLGKQINVSLVFSVAKWLFTVSMLSHVIIGLWSVKFDGSFNNEFAIEWNISLGRILHSLCGRRQKGRGRGGGRKARKKGKGKGSRRPLPSPPNPPLFFLPPYPLPLSTPATQATYCIVNNIELLIYHEMLVLPANHHGIYHSKSLDLHSYIFLNETFPAVI